MQSAEVAGVGSGFGLTPVNWDGKILIALIFILEILNRFYMQSKLEKMSGLFEHGQID